MKVSQFSSVIPILVGLSATAWASPLLDKRSTVAGIDISDFTTGVDFDTVKANGAGFVYIKATEGTSEYMRVHPYIFNSP